MLPSYLTDDIHLIHLKSFVGLIYIRVVPCTTLDQRWDNICNDVNLDGFIISQIGDGDDRGAWSFASQ